MLGAACTALALVLNVMLVAIAGSSRASIITYLNPLVAVLLGAIVLGEHLTIATGAGLVLILAGSWIATRRRGHAESEPVPEDPCDEPRDLTLAQRG